MNTSHVLLNWTLEDEYWYNTYELKRSRQGGGSTPLYLEAYVFKVGNAFNTHSIGVF